MRIHGKSKEENLNRAQQKHPVTKSQDKKTHHIGCLQNSIFLIIMPSSLGKVRIIPKKVAFFLQSFASDTSKKLKPLYSLF